MLILAIETSCDETSIGIIRGEEVIANIISSQIAEHAKYGGVVPEIAARLHLKNLAVVLKQALMEARIKMKEINYIAYTAKPGLIGALQIGKIMAETLSNYFDIPLLPINHLYGHIYGSAINKTFSFPLIAMLVSGGHTQLILMEKELNFKTLGSTYDDAIGECYDKVARMLGFNYPGGAMIDKLAQNGKIGNYRLPIPLDDESYNFSFSGLKSSVASLINSIKKTGGKIVVEDLCAEFQNVCVTIVLKKTKRAVEEFQPKMLVLVGGVSANHTLRSTFMNLNSSQLKVIVPDFEYCTDNGAMIARLAYQEVLEKTK